MAWFFFENSGHGSGRDLHIFGEIDLLPALESDNF